MATDPKQGRTLYIQVKTKRKGTWYSTKETGKKILLNEDEDRFWVFVNLPPGTKDSPQYWVVPEWWILNDIYGRVIEWRERIKGKYSLETEPSHHGIAENESPVGKTGGIF